MEIRKYMVVVPARADINSNRIKSIMRDEFKLDETEFDVFMDST